MYKKQRIYNTAFNVSKIAQKNKMGVLVKEFKEIIPICYGSFRSFGGTESVVDGLITTIDTAVIETWYTPLIQSDCKIKILNTGDEYEIIGTPENIENKNITLRFKVKKVGV